MKPGQAASRTGMAGGAMDRDTVTADGSKEITKLIRKAAPAASNEAEFRSRFSRVVEDFAKELEVRLLVREEYTLATGMLPTTDSGANAR